MATKMWMETKIKVCFIAQINVLWTRWQFGKLIDLPSNVNLIIKIGVELVHMIYFTTTTTNVFQKRSSLLFFVLKR